MRKNLMRAPLVLLLAGALLGGCSTLNKTTDTVTGWFSSSKSRAAKPAALVEFKETQRLAKAWTAASAEAGRGVFSPAAGADAVFVTGESGRVSRLNLQSGSEVWRTDLGKILSSGVGSGGGLAVVGGLKGEVIALDAASGSKKWEVALSSAVSAPPAIESGVVVVRTGDGKIYGLDAANGSRKWFYTRQLPALSLQGLSGLSIRDDMIYAGFPGGKLAAIKLASGVQTWEVSVSLPRGATELERVNDVAGKPMVDERKVCAVTYQGRVACFDRVKGGLLWARDVSSDAGLGMDEQFVYVTDDKDAITAMDKETGRAAWRQDKLANRQITAPLALGKFVVVADFEGFVHVLSAEDGSFVARQQADSSTVRATPLDIGPGFAVQTAKGGVTAFKLN
jgi:outer membrane protein assembly factor BamB